MSSLETLVIAGFGAQTSIGLDAPALSAAVAGGLNRFRFDRNFRSVKSGARITTAWLETLPDDWLAPQRMKALAVRAAEEALKPLLEHADARLVSALRFPVLLALPAPRAGFDQEAGAQLTREIIRGLPARIDLQSCSVVFAGHAGGITILSQAAQILAQGNSPAVLLGGVESHREFATLQSIELAGRLKTEDESLGWIPGEGAAFLLLARQSWAARAGLNTIFSLAAVAGAAEPLPWYSGRATLGTGLTQALQGVLRVPGSPVETYCDMNGEPWRVDEWGYAYLRTAGNYVDPLVIHHPADCWGDIGAASGPMLVALAAQNFATGREASSRALVWTASDVLPYRAACTIQKLSPGGSA
jgi:3-oxoacyl-[acyl-carrier-protein] synthase-1